MTFRLPQSATRRYGLAGLVLVTLVVGGLVLGLQAAAGDKSSGANRQSLKPVVPAVDAVGALKNPALAVAAVPDRVSSVASELSNPPSSVPASLRPGVLDVNAAHRLASGVGPNQETVYAMPTSSGGACYVTTTGRSGCAQSFEQEPGRALTSLDEPGRAGVDPVLFDGLVPDDVVRVSLLVNAKQIDATLSNNYFYYQLMDPSSGWPTSLIVTYSDGSTHAIDLPHP